ncbi:MAG: hypothetical protein K9N34_02320 [Candidatus Marinimicrobia bacterium]|nr:hypothetical protein [Candidatus Neomarinimicrobiota bacterium]MCF7840832.1 hypothetical protein [Candidatus Neomarinimicrobiota bacterium]MCF7901823.1 hypothetical protein [Candidatus Neomarinimicrobiota bacterium]
MASFYKIHVTRSIAYLRWLRMSTHWWRYFHASPGNLRKYIRMRDVLLSEKRWMETFSNHWHYDVHLDEFYKFLEQILDEFQIPRTVVRDYRVFCRARLQNERTHLTENRNRSFPAHQFPKTLVLRI